MEKIKKEQIVKSLVNDLKEAKSFVLTDFKGITVPQDTDLRKKMREAGISYTVIKNTLIKKALEELGIEGFDADLNNNTALLISKEDEIAPSKVITAEAKDNDKLKIKSGFLNGQRLDLKDITQLSKLPGMDELRAQLLRTMQGPIYGFVNTSAGVIRKFLYACNAIIEKKNEN